MVARRNLYGSYDFRRRYTPSREQHRGSGWGCGQLDLVERRAAAMLRAFRALYLGLPINCIIIGWVNLGMAKVLSITLGWNQLTAVFTGLAVTGAYVALSGLRGVVLTDLLQFGLAVVGSVAIAVFALRAPEIGGLEGLTEQLPANTFHFLPTLAIPDANTTGCGQGSPSQRGRDSRAVSTLSDYRRDALCVLHRPCP